MKIAVIAPPWVILPTNDYTGIETVINDLCIKLVDAGHEVILFAPFGSSSSSQLIHYPEDISSIDWQEADTDTRYFYKTLLSNYACVKAASMGVDIIHNFTLAGKFKTNTPILHTVFGPPTDNIIKICEYISQHENNYFVAVSNRQRVLFNEAAPHFSFFDTVHKSINVDKVEWHKEKDDYFLFLCHKEQSQELELAGRVSNAANKRLIAIIQGKKDQIFKDEIKPWLEKDTSNLNLQFAEDLPQESRFKLYSKAKGTFYIGQWEEPFGMEMLESLACGTPVIALSKGAAPEVITHKKTGFLVETEDEMIKAVNNIDSIDSSACRQSAENKFSANVITQKYLKIYNSILENVKREE
jgi:glycosyltransferase involved in cell wall biosynthesis